MTAHRCHRGERCALAEFDHDARVGAVIHTDRGLCLTCTSLVTNAIGQLPRDFAELTVHAARGSAGMVELVTASPDPLIPVRVDVVALRDEIARVTAMWAEPVADRLRVDWDTQAMAASRPGFVVDRACGLLAAALPVLLSLRDVEVQRWDADGERWWFEPEDGLDAACELLRLHQVIHAVLGRTALVHHLPAPCPSVECGRRRLVRHDGSETVRCEACGRLWAWEDYERLVLVLVG